MGIEIGIGGFSVAQTVLFTKGKLYKKIGSDIRETECDGADDGYNLRRGLNSDTRTIEKGEIFLALKGERFDGHEYLNIAFEKGAYAVVAEKIPENSPDGLYILVSDTTASLADIANAYRKMLPYPLVAVTGSVGKTTTKQFVYYVLSTKYNTLKTEANLNNQIGLPLTLLRADEKTEAGVAEMGMSGFGEIAQMSRAAEAEIGVITNIGTSHIGLLGSREGIRNAKCELLLGLKKGAALIYNGDEPLLDFLKSKDEFRVFDVSFENENAACYVFNIREHYFPDETKFDLKINGELIEDLRIPVIGRHNVFDAAVGTVVGKVIDISENDIRRGLSAFENTGLRQRTFEKNGIRVIADCYNASPESTVAALKVLKNAGKSADSRTVAILGDMRELGDHADELHRSVGKALAEIGIDCLFTVGDDGEKIALGAKKIKADIQATSFAYDEEKYPEIANAIGNEIRKGDTVLFKASRALRFEKIIDLLFE